MSYNISTKPQKLVLEVSNPSITLGVTTQQHTISLSRTGGQGSRGAGIASASIVAGELLLTMDDGVVVNAGSVGEQGVTGNAPADLDTLEKLAQAINNDANFFNTLRPLAYSASLNDVETGTLSVGNVSGGTF